MTLTHKSFHSRISNPTCSHSNSTRFAAKSSRGQDYTSRSCTNHALQIPLSSHAKHSHYSQQTYPARWYYSTGQEKSRDTPMYP
ncbi:hypothetical protein HanIR_Chr03g0133051 [Helianthus annuus]|nr:hypothetical protein HanIR_Chr03g0133051 [Helianthus annuus]